MTQRQRWTGLLAVAGIAVALVVGVSRCIRPMDVPDDPPIPRASEATAPALAEEDPRSPGMDADPRVTRTDGAAAESPKAGVGLEDPPTASREADDPPPLSDWLDQVAASFVTESPWVADATDCLRTLASTAHIEWQEPSGGSERAKWTIPGDRVTGSVVMNGPRRVISLTTVRPAGESGSTSPRVTLSYRWDGSKISEPMLGIEFRSGAPEATTALEADRLRTTFQDKLAGYSVSIGTDGRSACLTPSRYTVLELPTGSFGVGTTATSKSRRDAGLPFDLGAVEAWESAVAQSRSGQAR